MQGHQAHSRQLRRGSHRVSNSIGNVVEFQVEENAEPQARELLNGSRTFGGKKLAPDLERARNPSQFPRQRNGGTEMVYIQGYDQFPG
jgi:hypothetical protein